MGAVASSPGLHRLFVAASDVTKSLERPWDKAIGAVLAYQFVALLISKFIGECGSIRYLSNQRYAYMCIIYLVNATVTLPTLQGTNEHAPI